MININNTGRGQTLNQCTSYNCIHSSLSNHPAVGEKNENILTSGVKVNS